MPSAELNKRDNNEQQPKTYIFMSLCLLLTPMKIACETHGWKNNEANRKNNKANTMGAGRQGGECTSSFRHALELIPWLCELVQ